MEKNSFTLLETIISTFLLSIVVVGFSKYSYYENFDEHFILLNSLENSFNTNNYNSNFKKEPKTIKLLINSSEQKEILVDKIYYRDEKMEIVSYEVR